MLAEKDLLTSPSHNATRGPAKPGGQGNPLEADLPPSDDDEPAEPLPGLKQPKTTRQPVPPDPPANEDFSTLSPPHPIKNAKGLAPIPRLRSSHFKPYLEAPDITSAIDEFSPKKSFPTQDTIESPFQGSQVRRTVTQPPDETLDPAPIDDLFDDDDDDIAQKMQDAEEAYLNLDGQENGVETPNEERPTTVSNVDQYT